MPPTLKKELILEHILQAVRCSGQTWDPVLIPGQVFPGTWGCGQHGKRKWKKLLRSPTNSEKQFRMLLLLSLQDHGWAGKEILLILNVRKHSKLGVMKSAALTVSTSTCAFLCFLVLVLAWKPPTGFYAKTRQNFEKNKVVLCQNLISNIFYHTMSFETSHFRCPNRCSFSKNTLCRCWQAGWFKQYIDSSWSVPVMTLV